jgi:putative membrane protein
VNSRLNLPARAAILSAAGALISLSAATPLAFATSTVAAEEKVDVVNTETVQVYMDAEGNVESRRVYEQLVLTGQGSVDIENPISDNNLRNLDGFSGFTVKDGQQITEADVDGVERLRTVSDYDGKLPLDIDIAYKLDGKSVKPGDIVGEDGELEVEFTVTNVTGEEQEITIPDGKSGSLTRTATVPLPIVGSLTTFAPAHFTDVQSGQANMAGDGKGGTKLSFTMTLFPPIGSESATFGYTADIEDGVVPRVEVSALPVNPLQSPSFATAATSYQGGADTGTELAAGATEIDTNLLKLRDGAGDLLAGLLKLHAGSEELQAGLSGKAAPGAEKLADGAGDLNDGLGQIDDGAGQLSAGLLEVDTKAPRLITGLGDLREGLVLVDGGLAKLYNGVASVRDNPDYKALLAGLDKMLAGVGSKAQAESLTWAVDQVRSGLQAGLPKIQQMADGVYLNSATAPGAYQRLGCAVKVINLLNNGTGSADDPCVADFAPYLPVLGTESNPARKAVLGALATQLDAGRNALATPDGATNETTLYGGLKTLLAQLSSQDPNSPGAILALSTVECALDNTSLGGLCAAIRPGEAGLRQGLGQVVAGVPLLVNTIIATVQGGVGLASDTSADETLRGGMSDLIAGTDLIRSKGGDLIDGLSQLSDGAGRLADGTSEAAAGSGLLADGAGDLFDGISDAADGSGLLTDGLAKAADGAPKLVDGAGRLSKEGTQVIAGKGAETAQNYGELYAVLEAGSQRAQTEDMAFGAPEGANGLTAYNFIVKGEDGEGGRNWARGIAGLGLLAAGGGVFAYRRRML